MLWNPTDWFYQGTTVIVKIAWAAFVSPFVEANVEEPDGGYRVVSTQLLVLACDFQYCHTLLFLIFLLTFLALLFLKKNLKKKSATLLVYNTAVLLLTWLYLSLHATTFSLEDLNATSAGSHGPQQSTQMGESRRDFPCRSAPWHVCPRRDEIKAGLLLQQKSLLTPEAGAEPERLHLTCSALSSCSVRQSRTASWDAQ